MGDAGRDSPRWRAPALLSCFQSVASPPPSEGRARKNRAGARLVQRGMSSINRFREETPFLTTAAQPTAEQLDWLKAQGYEAIVNISTPTAKNFVSDEPRLVMEKGMTYVHVPVDCSALKPDHYALVSGVLKSVQGKKVLLHCAGNVKASAFAHIFRVKELGEDATVLKNELRQKEWHEPKWYAYFDTMGV